MKGHLWPSFESVPIYSSVGAFAMSRDQWAGVGDVTGHVTSFEASASLDTNNRISQFAILLASIDNSADWFVAILMNWIEMTKSVESIFFLINRLFGLILTGLGRSRPNWSRKSHVTLMKTGWLRAAKRRWTTPSTPSSFNDDESIFISIELAVFVGRFEFTSFHYAISIGRRCCLAVTVKFVVIQPNSIEFQLISFQMDQLTRILVNNLMFGVNFELSCV